MRIGVDIDGVMYQWTKTARYMLREILPDSPYTKDGPLGIECPTWDHIKDHVTREHYDWLWTEGVRLGLFRHGHMFPGTIKALRQLAECGDVIAVTHRPATAVTDTLDWLAFHRLPLSGVHILTSQQSKSRCGPFDYFIDDKPSNCVDLEETGAVVCMPDRPWNRDAQPPGVVRTYSWDEFTNIIKKGKHHVRSAY